MRNEKWKAKSEKAESERQLRVGQAGESSVYKLQMERTRRSHMTANAICEAHLHSRRLRRGKEGREEDAALPN